MKNKLKRKWAAFTPAGTLCYETVSNRKSKAIKKLLKAASHMPYGSWEMFKQRGYTVERVTV